MMCLVEVMALILWCTHSSVAAGAYDDLCNRPTQEPRSGVMRSHRIFDQEQLTAGTCGNTDEFYPDGKDKVVSVAYGSFAFGENCGMCIDIQNAQGVSKVLTVFESFNDVDSNELEVSESVMDWFNGGSSGSQTEAVSSMSVEWRFVPCPEVNISGNLRYRFSQGASEDNTPSIMVSNSPYGIRSASVQFEGSYSILPGRRQGPFRSMYFKLPEGKLTIPFNVRIISLTNEEVEFTVEAIDNRNDFIDTGVQFKGECFESDSATKDSANNSTSVYFHIEVLFVYTSVTGLLYVVILN